MATLSEKFKSLHVDVSRKRAVQIAALVAAFVFSFVFFLYLTFPYGVLKEAIASTLSKATGLNIRISELGPNLPSGVDFSGVQIESGPGGKAFKIEQIYAGVSLLNLLIARVAGDVELLAPGGGTLSVGVKYGLSKLLSGDLSMPSKFSFAAAKFPLDELVSFALGAAAQSPGMNAFIAPMLTKLGFRGRLNGDINLSFAKDARNSEGEFDIRINDGIFVVDDISLNIADQRFEKALIKGKLANGELRLDDASGFKTQELDVSIKGGISLRDTLPKSVLGIKLAVKLDRGLKEQFGFLLNSSGSDDASVAWSVSGTLAAPAFVQAGTGE